MAKFEPISLRLARDQGMQTNPVGISGVCGKLKCCLSYEQAQYREFAKAAPERGALVTTPHGSGKVIGLAVPAEAVLVRHRDGQTLVCPLLSVNRVPIAQRVTAPIVSAVSAASNAATAATSAATTVFKSRTQPAPDTAAD